MRHTSRNSSIAPGQASLSPSGSADATAAPAMTRYVTAALPDFENTTNLSSRSAK